MPPIIKTREGLVEVYTVFNRTKSCWMAQAWLNGRRILSECTGETANDSLVNAVEWLERSEYNEYDRRVAWRVE